MDIDKFKQYDGRKNFLDLHDQSNRAAILYQGIILLSNEYLLYVFIRLCR